MIVNFESLRDANLRRNAQWVGDKPPISLSFRGNELAGEVGEACNELKKIERHNLGLPGGKEDKTGLTEELADVIICVDLLAMSMGIDLGEAVRDKFNKTSDKYGLTTKL